MNRNKTGQSADIVFLCPVVFTKLFSNISFYSHPGINYILAYLKKKNISGVQIISEDRISVKEVISEIFSYSPKIIGFSCCDANYHIVKVIARQIKVQRPNVPIIIGGAAATFSDDLILNDCEAVDICVRGEGEYTVCELIESIKKGTSMHEVEGITYRRNRKIIKNSSRPQIGCDLKRESALDILPSPYLEGIITKDQAYYIITSRGCTYKCTYCNFSAMSGGTIRYHSIERVVSEIKVINDFFKDDDMSDKPTIVVYDDNFSFNIQRAKAILKRMIEENIKLKFTAAIRPDRTDEELIRLMKKAGFESVNFSLESASPRILSEMGKVGSPGLSNNNIKVAHQFLKHLKRCVDFCRSIGLTSRVSLILGLPYSTREDDMMTLRFAQDLNPDSYYHNVFRMFAGTTLFHQYEGKKNAIRETITRLPYDFKHSYKVRSIPYFDNAFQKSFAKGSVDNLFEMIAGVDDGQNKTKFPDVFITDHTLSDDAAKWLSRNLPISPRVCFLSDKSQPSVMIDNIKKLIRNDIPGVIFPVLSAQPSSRPLSAKNRLARGEYEFFLNVHGESKGKERNIYILGFSDWLSMKNSGKFNKMHRLDNKFSIIIESKSDASKIKKMLLEENHLVFDKNMLRIDSCFQDECKWHNSTCPALKLKRILIDDKGGVKTCFGGKTIARAGESIASIKKEIRSLYDETKKRRGCSECIAKNACSKCMFTYPLSEKQFCEIKRKNVRDKFNLYEAIRLFRVFSILKGEAAFSDIVFEGDIEKAVYSIDTKDILINVDGKRYVCDSEI